MKIELVVCKDCWKVMDQYQYPPICPCGSKFSRAVNATKFNLIKWFLTNPKHVLKLIILDLQGKDYE